MTVPGSLLFFSVEQSMLFALLPHHFTQRQLLLDHRALELPPESSLLSYTEVGEFPFLLVLHVHGFLCRKQETHMQNITCAEADYSWPSGLPGKADLQAPF